MVINKKETVTSRIGVWNGSAFVPNNPATYTINGLPTTDVFDEQVGFKTYELSNHLGNVLATITDRKVPDIDIPNKLYNYYNPQITSITDYYPFGMQIEERSWVASSSYRYGFNSMERDDEVSGDGNSLDFGARIYDSRLGRWMSVDPLQKQYSSESPYGFVLNTPIQAMDPDGRLVLFVNGLRGAPNPFKGQDYNHWQEISGIYSRLNQSKNAGVLKGYWKSNANTFGRKVDIARSFIDRISDENAYYTSGSSTWRSQAKAGWFKRKILGVHSRYHEGITKANMMHNMIKKGKIKLAKDETIKIVTHSQGGAHGAGMAARLIELGYTVEVIYNITPHQPTDITNPDGVTGVQYSHPNDAISSNAPIWLTNGYSIFGSIKGITEFDSRDLMGGEGQPPCEDPNGNKCGHNVDDNDFIFDIKPGENGYVEPRKDKPVQESN